MDMPLSIKMSLVIHYGTNNPFYQYYCKKRELPSSVTYVDLSVVRCSDATYSEQIATVAHKGRRLQGFAQDCYHAGTLTLCFMYRKLMICLSCYTPLCSGLPSTW